MGRYFISGITGSLGTIVSQKLLAKGHQVIGYSRDECKQARFQKHPNLTLYLGDIRDRDRLLEASRDAELFFHFAALKHVDKLEENPEESIYTNIIGTQNVLHAQRSHKISRVVLSSTDKACYPINVYGMSKGIAERLVMRNPNNVVCRYGNVLASRGSVVEKFVRSIRDKQMIELTDPNMSRFWITLEEASDFIISMSQVTGGLKIPSMRAASVQLVSEVIAKVLNAKSWQVSHVGKRAGEKIAECLRTEYEGDECHSNRVPQYTSEELERILTPILKEMAP